TICFFFQAEDGIRDFHVTGVQTCALPIYLHMIIKITAWLHTLNCNRLNSLAKQKAIRQLATSAKSAQAISMKLLKSFQVEQVLRSEERRVGKESRWRRERAEDRVE